MNTSLSLELFTVFLLAVASSAPVFKSDRQYVFPPDFVDGLQNPKQDKINHEAPLMMMNKPIRTEDETHAKPIRSSVFYTDTMKSDNDPEMESPFPSLRLVGSASMHFRFWKTVSKMAIPMVEFLGNSLEHLILNHCQENRDDIPNDCLEFSLNLIKNWNEQDFIRSPSDEVMQIRNQRKFDKSLFADVIEVLRYNRRNISDLLAIEKQHICGESSDCDVICTSENTLYCTVKEMIAPSLDKLILRLEKEAFLYFGIKTSKDLPPPMSSEKANYFMKYRVFYVLATMYNAMQQMHETEAALSYIVDLSKIGRLKVR